MDSAMYSVDVEARFLVRKRGAGNSVGGSGLYPPLLFDCTTERLFDCSKIEPTAGLLSSTTARWLRHP